MKEFKLIYGLHRFEAAAMFVGIFQGHGDQP